MIHLLIKYTIPLYMYLHVLDAVPMEEKLRQDLFSDYDNLSRSVDAWEDSVKVHLVYSPLYFMGLVCYSKLFKMTYLRYSGLAISGPSQLIVDFFFRLITYQIRQYFSFLIIRGYCYKLVDKVLLFF